MNNKGIELEIIEKITSFEEQSLNECNSLLLPYHEMITALGIELRVELSQTRGVYGARVEPYNLRETMKLPRFYSSKIMCCAYENGELLAKQEDNDKRVTSFFVMIFPLVRAWKKESELEISQTPFSNFDIQMNGLLEKASKHLAK